MTSISDKINQMIAKQLESAEFTSANPTHINTLIQVNELENQNFEDEILNMIHAETKKKEREEKEQPLEASKINFDSIKETDAEGILKKVGVEPSRIAELLALTGGKGGIGMMGKLGAIAGIAAPFGIAMMVQPVTEAVVAELQRPGGFLDKRVKIDAREETLAELDRQTRQNTRIGDRQVIIQQFNGFRNFEGFASTNTSEMIRTNSDRVLDIGLLDRAQGVQ